MTTMNRGRGKPIPGATGRRIPGTARLSAPRKVGNFLTNVPDQPSSAMFREAHRQQVRDSKGRFQGGWGFAWQGLEKIDAALVDWNNQFHQDLHDAVESLKDEMVASMQSNAPWTDRTGNARRELQGVVVWEDEDHFTIFLGHGADIYYGIWLEVAHGGEFAIVLPTVMEYAPKFGNRLATMT